MAHDIFISYSSKDKPIADGICANLESAGLRCWIAPRDIVPGEDWPTAITTAISNSRVMVLVFSTNSNTSEDVGREIILAANHKLVIIPFKIDDSDPEPGKQYYLARTHWLEAMNPPTREQIQSLVKIITSVIPLQEKNRVVQPTVDVPPPAGKSIQTAPLRKPRSFKWIWMCLLGLLVLVILGLILWPKIQGLFASPTVTQMPATTGSPTKTVEFVENLPDLTSTPSGGGDWRPVSFLIPNPQIWDETEDNRYTAIGQKSVDAFAWSTETFEGDLTVSLELESPENQSEGCIIIYGDGHGYSYGSLIFCIESEFYTLEKHTRYHEGENFLIYSQSNINFKDKIYLVTIEIIGDTVTMIVNGEKVLSTFFDTKEIDRIGRIGLNKLYIGSEIAFSNIQVKTSAGRDSNSAVPATDEWDCAIDSGAQPDYYPVESSFSVHPIQVDGEISSPEEWGDAKCVDLRMHYSINVTNPNFHKIRWWVQNNEQDIFFLVRIPVELNPIGVYINYFWPEYTGTWAHSDGVYANKDGEIFDHGKWDELQWFSDKEMNPPGTINVQAAQNEFDGFYWFEVMRPLNSGDRYDWTFEPGQRIGNNPLDSFMVGIHIGEGEFIRYFQLLLGEP